MCEDRDRSRREERAYRHGVVQKQPIIDCAPRFPFIICFLRFSWDSPSTQFFILSLRSQSNTYSSSPFNNSHSFANVNAQICSQSCN